MESNVFLDAYTAVDSRSLVLKRELEALTTVKNALAFLSSKLPVGYVADATSVKGYPQQVTKGVRVEIVLDSLVSIESYLNLLDVVPKVFTHEIGQPRIWTEPDYLYRKEVMNQKHIDQATTTYCGWHVVLKPMDATPTANGIGFITGTLMMPSDEPNVMDIPITVNVSFPDALATVVYSGAAQDHLTDVISADTGQAWASGVPDLIGQSDLLYNDLESLKSSLVTHWRRS